MSVNPIIFIKKKFSINVMLCIWQTLFLSVLAFPGNRTRVSSTNALLFELQDKRETT